MIVGLKRSAVRVSFPVGVHEPLSVLVVRITCMGVLERRLPKGKEQARHYAQMEEAAHQETPILHFARSRVDVAYAGSHGLKLPQDRGLNPLPDSALALLIDYANSFSAGESLGGGGFQNLHNLRADRAVSVFDQTHRSIFKLGFHVVRSYANRSQGFLQGIRRSGGGNGFGGSRQTEHRLHTG